MALYHPQYIKGELGKEIKKLEDSSALFAKAVNDERRGVKYALSWSQIYENSMAQNDALLATMRSIESLLDYMILTKVGDQPGTTTRTTVAPV